MTAICETHAATARNEPIKFVRDDRRHEFKTKLPDQDFAVLAHNIDDIIM